MCVYMLANLNLLRNLGIYAKVPEVCQKQFKSCITQGTRVTRNPQPAQSCLTPIGLGIATLGHMWYAHLEARRSDMSTATTLPRVPLCRF